MRGDGLQNGGLLIVKEGKIIYSFVQENPADHASNADILKVQYSFQLLNYGIFLAKYAKATLRIA